MPSTKSNPNRSLAKKLAEEKVIDYHEYVDQHISRTGRAVKAVDIGYALLRLVVVVSAALLVAALAEHWLVTGGFSSGVRYLFFVLLAMLSAHWFVREMWPLLTRRINPVYAARSIEQASPSLKNSLVNLLLFRSRQQQMPTAVYDALEQQAAERLVVAGTEEITDRSGLVRLGAVIVGLMIVGALYTLISPKSPLRSAARLLMPWAEIAAPSRVQITDVQPGSSDAVVGRPLELAADVTGLEQQEQPELVLLGSDAEHAERLPMTTGNDRRFAVEWSPAESAANRSGGERYVRYRIEAGDARSPTYKLRLLTAPAIVVDRVEYDYPAYTGYVDRETSGVGDLRGIEGTKITLHAAANTQIDTAQIDFGGDGSPDVSMKPVDSQATGGFTLSLRRDRRTPRHNSYVLRFTSAEGRANDDPASYRIEVTPDLMPTAELTAPEEPTRDVRLNEAVIVRLEARDPDFALSSVRLKGNLHGEEVFDAVLLEGSNRESWHEGRFEGRWRFVPAEHGLRAGDIVEYWAEAADNRQPKPQVAQSTRQRFRITAPDAAQDGGQAMAENDDPQAGSENDGGERKAEEGEQQGQPDQESAEYGNSGDQSSDSSDGQQGESGEQDQQQGGQNGGQQGEQQDQQSGEQEGNSQDQPGGLSSNQSAGQGEGEQQQGEGQPGETDGAGEESGQSGGGKRQSNGKTDGAERETQRGESEGQPSDSSSSEPVSSDGDDDATAFERIREHLKERNDSRQPENQQQNSAGQRGEGEQSGEKNSPDDPQRNESQNNKSQQGDSQNQAGEQQGKGNRSQNQQPSGQQQNGVSQQDQSATGKQPEEGQQPGGENQQAGDNNDSQGDAGQQGTNRGEQAGDQASPERDASDGDSQSSDEDQPSGGGERSDSQSSESGQQGADERNTPSKDQGPREGTGSLGQNQAADEGTGTAGDEGPGETTDRPGQQQQANGEEQGKPGNERGDGQTKLDGQGDQSGGAEGNRTGEPSPSQSPSGNDQPSKNQPQNGASDIQQAQEGTGQQGDSNNQNESASDSQGGRQQDGQSPKDSSQANRSQDNSGEQGDRQGNPPNRSSDPASPSGNSSPQQSGSGGGAGDHRGGEVGGDEANLEYARQQTDLVLEKLSDQLNNKQVDEELLEKLGWTEQELAQFVNRWKATKQAAQKPGNARAQQELDAALRSLGIRQRNLGGQTNVRQDQLRDLQSGYRGKVPAKFRDRLRQYNRGVSKSVRD